MTRTDQAILIVRESLEHFESNEASWAHWYFDQATYSRWAGDELIDLLKHNRSIAPIRLVNEFTKKMDVFSVMGKENNIMFSIAKDFSENIGDILRDMS